MNKITSTMNLWSGIRKEPPEKSNSGPIGVKESPSKTNSMSKLPTKAAPSKSLSAPNIQDKGDSKSTEGTVPKPRPIRIEKLKTAHASILLAVYPTVEKPTRALFLSAGVASKIVIVPKPYSAKGSPVKITGVGDRFRDKNRGDGDRGRSTGSVESDHRVNMLVLVVEIIMY